MIDKEVGQPIRLSYVRPSEKNPKSRAVELTLLPRPVPDGRALAKTYFQMEVSELTAAVARRFNFESAYPILIVAGVEAGGGAARAGIKPGDLILQVGNMTPRDLPEFALQMERVSAGDTVELLILRITTGPFGQMERRFPVRLEARPRNGSL
jgi:S1-C subfamily serine protease